MKSPRAPPTAATIAAKLKRRTSSTIVTSVVDHFKKIDVIFGSLLAPLGKSRKFTFYGT